MHHQHAKAHAADNKQRLRAVLLLSGAYMVAEAIGGLITNSLALLADAGHMLSDVAALGLSLFALWVAGRPPTAQRTYGYYRAEILAALANGVGLVLIAIYVFIEASHRLGTRYEVRGPLMMEIAIGGLLVNLISLWLLRGGTGENLNVRGAWLHVLGDALGSVGAIAAGALILAFGWNWADPVASVLIALLVLYSAWSLVREAVAVLLEGAPGHIDVDELHDSIMASEGVLAVHDLHVWTIASGLVALSCHVVAGDGTSRRALLESLNGLLEHRYGIHHTTIQIEPEDFGICETCR
jgi:cobalt-zinc-cadmium efflux system protein